MRKVIIGGDDFNWIKADLNGGANDEDQIFTTTPSQQGRKFRQLS